MKKNSVLIIILCFALIGLISTTSCKRGATSDPVVGGPAGYRIVLSGTANPSTLYVPQSEPATSTLIAVRALKNDGKPASGYTIVFEDGLGYGFFEGYKLSDTRVTDSNGRAQITYFLPPASNVRSTITGAIKATLVDNGRLDNLPLSDVWDVVPLRIIPYMNQGVVIHGNVLTPSGNGVEGVTIALEGDDGNPSGVTVTRPSGSYEFFVSPGWYGSITPSAKGYTFSPSAYTFTTANPIMTDRYYVDFIAEFGGGNTLAVDVAQWDVVVAGGTVSINVTNGTGDANIGYTVMPNSPWIHVNPSSGVTPGSFTVVVDENTSGEDRSGEILISATDTQATSVKVSINQKGNDVPAGGVLAADITTINVEANIQTSTTINVYNSGTNSTSIDYIITPNVNWIVVSKSRGTTNDSFILNTIANAQTSRTGTVTLTPTSTGVTNIVIITVNQGGGPSLAVSPTTYTSPATAGSTFIATVTNPTSSDVMTWSVNTDVTWIGIVPNNGTTANASVLITIQAANPNTTPRQAIITFLASNGAKATILVTQVGKD